MSQNTFHRAPPPPPFDPGASSWQPIERPQRRWPALTAAIALGAIVASLAAVVATVQVRDTTATTPSTPAAVTVTAPAPTLAQPTPWPTAEADRHICYEGSRASQVFIDQAKAQMALLPAGLKTDDPIIVNDPHWQGVVDTAGEFYRQAGDALADEIPPGATPILAEAANTRVNALRFLGDTTSEPELVYISGRAVAISNATSRHLAALCGRLAP